MTNLAILITAASVIAIAISLFKAGYILGELDGKQKALDWVIDIMNHEEQIRKAKIRSEEDSDVREECVSYR